MSPAEAVVDSYYLGNALEGVRSGVGVGSRTIYEVLSDDTAIHGAFLAFCAASDGRSGENILPLVTDLLNRISAVYSQHYPAGPSEADPAAVAFAIALQDVVLGDHIEAITHGLIISVATPATINEDAGEPSSDAVQWRPLTSVGQCRRYHQRLKKPLYDTLSDLKAYRPDLSTIHAFDLEGQSLTLHTRNACGWTRSDAWHANQLDPWIAHVALVYKTHCNRDRRFEQALKQGHFPRWTLSLNGRKSELAPFVARGEPGRGTWVAFEVAQTATESGEHSCRQISRAYLEQSPVGLVKMSWQYERLQETQEGKLLDYAHRDGWVPGLVRHLGYQRAASNVDEDGDMLPGQPNAVQDVDGKVTVVKEILWVASVGQPLSQCESLEHLLSVAYDALEGKQSFSDEHVLTIASELASVRAGSSAPRPQLVQRSYQSSCASASYGTPSRSVH